eukprot:352507-Chlamydomonas_euryale.AAC.8
MPSSLLVPHDVAPSHALAACPCPCRAQCPCPLPLPRTVPASPALATRRAGIPCPCRAPCRYSPALAMRRAGIPCPCRAPCPRPLPLPRTPCPRPLPLPGTPCPRPLPACPAYLALWEVVAANDDVCGHGDGVFNQRAVDLAAVQQQLRLRDVVHTKRAAQLRGTAHVVEQQTR